MSARSDGWTAAAEMALEQPLHGVAAGHFTHGYFPSRLAWLEARSASGRRGELATHFEWAHCDPLQLIAEHSPADEKGLRAISGVGPSKLTKYGDEVLALVADASKG